MADDEAPKRRGRRQPPAPMEEDGRGSGDEAEEVEPAPRSENDATEAAPPAFDEEEATRRAKKMKVDELRAVL